MYIKPLIPLVAVLSAHQIYASPVNVDENAFTEQSLNDQASAAARGPEFYVATNQNLYTLAKGIHVSIHQRFEDIYKHLQVEENELHTEVSKVMYFFKKTLRDFEEVKDKEGESEGPSSGSWWEPPKSSGSSGGGSSGSSGSGGSSM